MLEGTFSIVYRAVEYFTPVEVCPQAAVDVGSLDLSIVHLRAGMIEVVAHPLGRLSKLEYSTTRRMSVLNKVALETSRRHVCSCPKLHRLRRSAPSSLNTELLHLESRSRGCAITLMYIRRCSSWDREAFIFENMRIGVDIVEMPPAHNTCGTT